MTVPNCFLVLNKQGEPACIFDKVNNNWKQYDIVSGQLEIQPELWMIPDEMSDVLPVTGFDAICENCIILSSVANWKAEYDHYTSDPDFWIDF